VDFAFGDEEIMMGEAARSLLARALPFEVLRADIDAHIPFRSQHWRMAADAGWTGALVAASDSGAELGLVQLCLPLVECGASLLPLPLVEALLVFPTVLRRHGTEEQRRRWLPAVAEGTCMPTVDVRRDLPDRPRLSSLRARRENDHWHVTGQVQSVPFGAQADVAIVWAEVDDGGEPERGQPGVAVILDAHDGHVQWTALDGFDLTVPLARSEVDVTLPADRILEGADVRATAWHVARVGCSLLAVGGMKRLLQETTVYLTEREQFGRPIGSFQAVKHHAADMRLRLDTAEPAAYYAAWGFDHDAPDRFESATVAYVTACAGYLEVAKTAIQLHGALGYTWDRGLHLYLRRAQCLTTAAGSTRDWCVQLGVQARTQGLESLE
jgi:hypothetical protein